MNTTPNNALQRTRSAPLRSPLSFKTFGDGAKARVGCTRVLQLATLSLLSLTCDTQAPQKAVTDTRRVVFTASQAERLHADRSLYLAPAGPYWTPAEGEIVDLESKVAPYLATHAFPDHERSLIEGVTALWPAYHRQYLGHTEGGRRLVYLNAFCDRGAQDHRDWQAQFVMVMDGGACYFQASYDPARREILRIWVNGLA